MKVQRRSSIPARNANQCPLVHADRPIIDIYRTVFVSVFLGTEGLNVNYLCCTFLALLSVLKQYTILANSFSELNKRVSGNTWCPLIDYLL